MYIFIDAHESGHFTNSITCTQTFFFKHVESEYKFPKSLCFTDRLLFMHLYDEKSRDPRRIILLADVLCHRCAVDFFF